MLFQLTSRLARQTKPPQPSLYAHKYKDHVTDEPSPKPRDGFDYPHSTWESVQYAMTSFFVSLSLSIFTAGLFLTFQNKRSRKAVSADSLHSCLIPAYTTHARLLPTTARHAFSYPLLYVGVDIDSLEDGSLDLPGRIFSYGGRPITKVLGLRSDGYLESGKLSLREKLERLLDAQGMKSEEIGKVWLVTMPSFMGFEGINPLSVWYHYGKVHGEDCAELICVILEVHNTFGEKWVQSSDTKATDFDELTWHRHAYVLKIGSDLQHDPKPG